MRPSLTYLSGLGFQDLCPLPKQHPRLVTFPQRRSEEMNGPDHDPQGSAASGLCFGVLAPELTGHNYGTRGERRTSALLNQQAGEFLSSEVN